jgi:hypothetical protein
MSRPASQGGVSRMVCTRVVQSAEAEKLCSALALFSRSRSASRPGHPLQSLRRICIVPFEYYFARKKQSRY